MEHAVPVPAQDAPASAGQEASALKEVMGHCTLLQQLTKPLGGAKVAPSQHLVPEAEHVAAVVVVADPHTPLLQVRPEAQRPA